MQVAELGIAYTFGGKVKEAQEVLPVALDCRRWCDAYLIEVLASTYIRTQNYERAERLLSRAITILGDNAKLFNSLGVALNVQGRHNHSSDNSATGVFFLLYPCCSLPLSLSPS